jgi:glycosyltransferase involved in cell wall biosynthesis
LDLGSNLRPHQRPGRFPGRARSRTRPAFHVQAYRALARILRALRPDIVHTHSGKAGFLGRWAAHRAQVPVIVHTIHGPSFGSFQSAAANLVFRAAERSAGSITTHFVSVAQAMSEQYLAAGIGERNRYTRIFSGFQLKPFLEAKNDESLRRQLGIKPSDIVIGTIARLFNLKGHDDLITVAPELIRACPNVKFLWVGDGAWRARLEERIRQLGLSSHFVLVGLVPPTEVPAYLGLMDVLVHLSRREGLARALPQALATGCPIVAYDCDGARSVFQAKRDTWCPPTTSRH